MESLIASELLACNIACEVQRRNVGNIFPPLPSHSYSYGRMSALFHFTKFSSLQAHRNKKESIFKGCGPSSLSTMLCVPIKHFMCKAYNHFRIN
jgi:hypothetical protein